MRTDRRQLILGGPALAATTRPARAQAPYPTRPIRLVVPYPAGGGTDFFARIASTAMGARLGQPVIVENRPGAATIIGADAVAHAAPDGYTILLGDTATYAANKSMYQKLPYDPARDFAPITLTGRFAIVLLVNAAKLKVGSAQELVAAARQAPGAIDYASSGVGSPFHLAMELFASAARVKLNHVPYRGVAPALQDLAAAQIGVMFVDFASARSQLATPNIKAIAVAAAAEFAGLPGVPTVAAAGYPGFEAWAWQGFVAPAATPAAIIDKIQASYVAAAKDPEIVAKLTSAGIDVLQSTPAEFAAYMRAETEKWDRVIKAANIHAD
jgi:tripartite-type tricarboxylate transporter receptor subunit TctC